MAHGGDRGRPEPADRPDAHAVAGAAQRLGVDVRERLVLVEGLEADADPRPFPACARAAEPVGVGELATHGLGDAAVDDLLVEAAQLQRGEQPRRGVEPAPQPPPVAAQEAPADDGDDVVLADHVPVVAQREDVRARQLRVGGEDDGDLGDAVVEGLDAGVGDRSRPEDRGGVDAVDPLEAGDAVDVAGAVRPGGEPDLRHLRRAGGRGDECCERRQGCGREPHPHAADATSSMEHGQPIRKCE
jgi:hypothetical protein